MNIIKEEQVKSGATWLKEKLLLLSFKKLLQHCLILHVLYLSIYIVCYTYTLTLTNF